MDGAVQQLQGAYQATTQGQFAKAVQMFTAIHSHIPHLVTH